MPIRHGRNKPRPVDLQDSYHAIQVSGMALATDFARERSTGEPAASAEPLTEAAPLTETALRERGRRWSYRVLTRIRLSAS